MGKPYVRDHRLSKIFLGLLFLLFDETAVDQSLLFLLSSLLGGFLLLRGSKEEKDFVEKSVLLARTAGVFLCFLMLSGSFGVIQPLIQNELRQQLFHFVLSEALFIADAAVFWAAAETAAEVYPHQTALLSFGYSCGFLRLLSALSFPFPRIKLTFRILSILSGSIFLFLVGSFLRKEREASHQTKG